MNAQPAVLVDLSRDYLDAVRNSDDTAEIRARLSGLSTDELAALEPAAAKAFWLNIYNATAQEDLRDNPHLWSSKRTFFGDPRVTVGGHELSLDDIEHGILRHSRWKYGLGYLPRPFPDDFERAHRLPAVDPRIHFGLNCGAESCPVIAPYTAGGVDEELDIDARDFLASTCERRDGTLYVSRLLLYYRGDFGGRAGVYQFLEEHGILENETPRIRYQSYDWSLAVGRFHTRDGGDA